MCECASGCVCTSVCRCVSVRSCAKRDSAQRTGLRREEQWKVVEKIVLEKRKSSFEKIVKFRKLKSVRFPGPVINREQNSKRLKTYQNKSIFYFGSTKTTFSHSWLAAACTNTKQQKLFCRSHRCFKKVGLLKLIIKVKLNDTNLIFTIRKTAVQIQKKLINSDTRLK